MLTDHLFNALVYGVFYESSSRSLNEFLVPMIEFGTPLSYALGSLYSYLQKETNTQTVVLVWSDLQYDVPCVSPAEGVAPILGNTLYYNCHYIQQIGFSTHKYMDLGMDQTVVAQHLSYIALLGWQVVLCALPVGWIHSHNEEFSSWVDSITSAGDSVVYIDDFMLKEQQNKQLEIEMEHDSLAAYYHQKLHNSGQAIHLLAVHPFEKDQESIQAVLGM